MRLTDVLQNLDDVRKVLQRRIRNQRWQLRLLNKQILMKNALIARYKAENQNSQSIWMRFAARETGRYFFAKSAERFLRKWGG